jgi:hypothetical protein
MALEAQSDNVKRAMKIIDKYPQVFEALLEFEKTGKLPDKLRKKEE